MLPESRPLYGIINRAASPTLLKKEPHERQNEQMGDRSCVCGIYNGLQVDHPGSQLLSPSLFSDRDIERKTTDSARLGTFNGTLKPVGQGERRTK